MPLDPDELFPQIVADLATESRAIAEKIVGDVKDRIGVPVEYVTGPRGGTIVIRSKRGEPPRKEKGKLSDGVTSDVIVTDNQVAAAVYDEVSYSEPLEDELDRPILTDLLDTYEDYIADGLARAAAGEA